MNREIRREQVQHPPKHKVGDTVCYGSYPMTVATIINFTEAFDRAGSPGIYYGLRTPEMMRNLLFVVPEFEVSPYLPVVA